MSKTSARPGGVHDRSRNPSGAAADREATARDGGNGAATGLVPSVEPQGGERPGTPFGGGLHPRSTSEDAERSDLDASVERHERRRAEIAAERAACAPAAQLDLESAASPEPGHLVEPKSLGDDDVDRALAAVVEGRSETAAPTEQQPAPPAAEPAPATTSQLPTAPTAPPSAGEPDPWRPICPDRNLPLGRYLQEAIEAESHWMSDEGPAQLSVEYGDVQWKAGFHFIRLCRAHRDLAELEALQALERVQGLMRLRWGPGETLRRIFGDLAGMFDCDSVDLPARWLSSWTQVRFIPGESPILHAVRLADRFPLQPEHHSTDLPGYPRLFSIVAWLSWVRGDEPMYLAVRTLAPHVPCAYRTVATYLLEMHKTGALLLVKRHPLGDRKASEYRFLLRERYQWLVDGPPA